MFKGLSIFGLLVIRSGLPWLAETDRFVLKRDLGHYFIL